MKNVSFELRSGSLPELGLRPSSDKGKEKIGLESGLVGSGRSVRLSSRGSWSEASSRRGSVEGGDRSSVGLRDRSVQIGQRGGQFGLKFFTDPKYQKAEYQVGSFGQRYDKDVHGDLRLGPYRIVGDKTRGVEPGFVAKKAWTDSDTAKMRQDGHKYSVEADSWLRSNLNSLGGSFQVRKMAAEILTQRGDTGFRPGTDDVYRFLRSHPEVERNVLDQLKQKDGVQRALIDHISAKEPKFNQKHYVKLDYRETERSGAGADKTYTLPKSNAKSFGFGAIGKFFHQLMRRQTPDAINRDAMRESLANDLMKSFGIFAQKLKLVPTTYTDGTPKLLLDGTHMTGPKGEAFSDFEGAIKGGPKNGQLVKLGEDGKPVKNARGHYEVDTSIEKLGRNKIFMLLLGDRDAIGSSGGNKGRVGNMFAAIDPGHSLELGGQRLMEKRDIHSDMSFDQPSRLAGKCYKNFTIFDQSPFSERMEGVRQLSELRKSGKDLEVFEDYAGEFNAEKQPGMNFEEQIGGMRRAYEARRDYILDDVLAERLAVYDYDMSAVGDAAAQEKAKAQTLDVLDTLEKITSKHAWMNGNIELEHPRVTSRTEWNVKESDDSVEFSLARPTRDASRELENFMEHAGLKDGYTLSTRSDGTLVLSVPKRDMGDAFDGFSVANLRAYDNAKVERMVGALRDAGLA